MTKGRDGRQPDPGREGPPGIGPIAARVLFLAIACCVPAPGGAAAQLSDWLGRAGVEVRGGVSVGNHSESAAALELTPEPSFDVVLKTEIISTLSVFGGYYRTAFGCVEGFCTGRDITVVGNHGAVGALWVPDIPQLPMGPWIRAGLLMGTTRAGTEGDPPDIGFGFEFGAGLQRRFGRVQAFPGVSYRYLTANTPSSSAYAVALSAHLGIAIGLGGG